MGLKTKLNIRTKPFFDTNIYITYIYRIICHFLNCRKRDRHVNFFVTTPFILNLLYHHNNSMKTREIKYYNVFIIYIVHLMMFLYDHQIIKFTLIMLKTNSYNTLHIMNKI